MVSMLVGWSPGGVKPKTIKLVFVTSPQSTQHKRRKSKTDWLESE
jgi:hypothetical protein